MNTHLFKRLPGAIEARTGLSDRRYRGARRAGYGLAVAARAGGGGRPRAPRCPLCSYLGRPRQISLSHVVAERGKYHQNILRLSVFSPKFLRAFGALLLS